MFGARGGVAGRYSCSPDQGRTIATINVHVLRGDITHYIYHLHYIINLHIIHYIYIEHYHVTINVTLHLIHVDIRPHQNHSRSDYCLEKG